MNAPHVIIIGGGFAGVSAAHHLLAYGARVTLLDAHRTLGGRARSDHIGGTTIDIGAQLIATSFTHTLRLFDGTAAGVPSGLHASPGRDAVMIGDERIDLQFGSVRSLLTFRGLGAMDKLRLGRHLLPIIARHRADLEAGALRLPAALDARSSGPWLRSHIGERANELLGEVAANAFYAANADDTSLAFLLTLGRYASDSDMLAARDGWSGLLAGAVRGAEVQLDVTADALRADAAGVTVRTTDDRQWQGEAAIIATGPRTASELLASSDLPASALHEWLASLRLCPTVTLALAVDVPLERTRFGIFRLRSEARVVSACASHGAKLPGLTSSGDVALAWPTPAHAERLASAPAEEVVAAMLPEVEEMLPAVRGRVTHARVYRFTEGTPLPHPSFGAHRAIGRDLADALPPHIALAGDYLAAPLTEGAVLTGEWAAARIAAALGTR